MISNGGDLFEMDRFRQADFIGIDA